MEEIRMKEKIHTGELYLPNDPEILSEQQQYLEKLYDFISTLKNVEKTEVLPYHTFGEYKWKELGYEYPLAGIEPPAKERIENANRILHTGQ